MPFPSRLSRMAPWQPRGRRLSARREEPQRGGQREEAGRAACSGHPRGLPEGLLTRVFSPRPRPLSGFSCSPKEMAAAMTRQNEACRAVCRGPLSPSVCGVPHPSSEGSQDSAQEGWV